MKTSFKVILISVLSTLVIMGIVFTAFENVDADDIHKGIGKTEIWEPGPEDGPVSIPERTSDARLVTEYMESNPITHKNNVTNDQLKEKLELVLNARIGIASSGIDYDIGQLVFYAPDFAIEKDIKNILGDFPFVLLYEEAPPRWEHDGPEEQKEMPTTTYYDPTRYYEIFTETGPLGLLGVNEKGDVISGSPLLSEINCMRYVNWLTEFQKEKIDISEDFPRYPPWGNEIFPLVDYCLANGDLIKTIHDDKIHWEFQLNEN